MTIADLRTEVARIRTEPGVISMGYKDYEGTDKFYEPFTIFAEKIFQNIISVDIPATAADSMQIMYHQQLMGRKTIVTARVAIVAISSIESIKNFDPRHNPK